MTIGTFAGHHNHEQECSDREKLMLLGAKEAAEINSLNLGGDEVGRADRTRKALDLKAVAVYEEDGPLVLDEDVHRVDVPQENTHPMQVVNLLKDANGNLG
jgi:hypothetical protein